MSNKFVTATATVGAAVVLWGLIVLFILGVVTVIRAAV